jgi:hypothetical protein
MDTLRITAMDSISKPNQRNKSIEEKIEPLKVNFAQNSKKIDFVRKSDGFNYCIGSIGLNDNQEYRIWKTLDTVHRSSNAEYIYKSYNEKEALNKFNELTA